MSSRPTAPAAATGAGIERQREEALKVAVTNTEAAGSILCAARERASDLGIAILNGAYIYLYAAMFADVALAVKQDDWIGPSVRMDDSTIKPTEQFLIDHLFETVFKPIVEKGGAEFLNAVRKKVKLIAQEASPHGE